MGRLDPLRRLPRWTYAAVGGALGLAVLISVVLAVTRGAEEVRTRDRIPVAVGTTSTTAVPMPETTGANSSTIVPALATTNTTTVRSLDIRLDIREVYDPEFDVDDPGVVARPIPAEPTDTTPPSTVAPPPWAASTRTTASGHVGVDVGCVDDLGANTLDRFFAQRVGPVLGWDYQHVYPLGGDRYLWLFQDTFVDHTGTVNNLGKARFVHNAALVQQGTCFTLLHRGTTAKPSPFEEGDGSGGVLTSWFWPMGGELADGKLAVFWVQMVKDAYDPRPPDGLGWHPQRLWLATYDAATLKRLSFVPAADPGVTPIYGYAVSSDASHTYLFGNTFEQNLVREGGFWKGPHSATQMWLARVPRGKLTAAPEYRTADGWSPQRADAVPILSRFFAENPMQPRYLDGQWVAATDVDGYWGNALAIDVAADPWGPWTTVEYFGLETRGNDPLMNNYHAHLLPWRDRFGSVIVTVSNNARDMLRDAWPRPDRYRPMVTYSAFRPTPAPTTTTTSTSTTTTTLAPTTTSTTTTTTLAPTTTSTTTTTLAPTTSSSTSTTTSTTTTSTSTTTLPPG